MSEFTNWLYMDGHGPYVWGAYGVTAVILLINVIAPLNKHKQIVEQFSRQQRREQARAKNSAS